MARRHPTLGDGPSGDMITVAEIEAMATIAELIDARASLDRDPALDFLTGMQQLAPMFNAIRRRAAEIGSTDRRAHEFMMRSTADPGTEGAEFTVCRGYRVMVAIAEEERAKRRRG